MSFASRHDTRAQYHHVEDEIEAEQFLQSHDQQQAPVHLATTEEKKRLWWRNAFITGACIAFWYVRCLPIFQISQNSAGFYLQRCYRYIISGCSRPSVMDSHSHSSSLVSICGSSLRALHLWECCYRRIFVPQRSRRWSSMGECKCALHEAMWRDSAVDPLGKK